MNLINRGQTRIWVSAQTSHWQR